MTPANFLDALGRLDLTPDKPGMGREEKIAHAGAELVAACGSFGQAYTSGRSAAALDALARVWAWNTTLGVLAMGYRSVLAHFSGFLTLDEPVSPTWTYLVARATDLVAVEAAGNGGSDEAFRCAAGAIAALAASMDEGVTSLSCRALALLANEATSVAVERRDLSPYEVTTAGVTLLIGRKRQRVSQLIQSGALPARRDERLRWVVLVRDIPFELFGTSRQQEVP